MLDQAFNFLDKLIRFSFRAKTSNHSLGIEFNPYNKPAIPKQLGTL